MTSGASHLGQGSSTVALCRPDAALARSCSSLDLAQVGFTVGGAAVTVVRAEGGREDRLVDWEQRGQVRDPVSEGV